MNAYLLTELVAGLPARIGMLAEVSAALRDARVDIRAISAYQRDEEAKFLLVTNDADAAEEVLANLGSDVRRKTVLAVEVADQPGGLAEAAKRIADAGIELEYVFGTSAQEALGPETTLVFKTSDDEKAVTLF